MKYQAKVSPQKDADSQVRPIHFGYIDGLRGFAALYVVIFHFCLWSAGDIPRWSRFLLGWTAFGHFSVDVFITLSGFCLMLPVIKSQDLELRGGFIAYIKRRAWRILPPYYAALALAVLVAILSPQGIEWTQNRFHTNDQQWITNFTIGDIGSHILLVHNLNNDWSGRFDMALWSIATEWQIYFFFPLLLLPACRRFGALSAVIVGFALGILPHLLLPKGHNFDWACPWYLGLFAVGMLSAIISTTSNRISEHSRFLPWATVFMGLLYIAAKFGRFEHIEWLKDAIGGLTAATVITYCAIGTSRGHRSPILSIFNSKLAAGLGSWSYSLYLTHCLILTECGVIQHAWRISDLNSLILRIFIGIPVALAFGYVFFIWFERPYLKARSANRPAGNAVTATEIALNPTPSPAQLG